MAKLADEEAARARASGPVKKGRKSVLQRSPPMQHNAPADVTRVTRSLTYWWEKLCASAQNWPIFRTFRRK
jgi:hypothetical protein